MLSLHFSHPDWDTKYQKEMNHVISTFYFHVLEAHSMSSGCYWQERSGMTCQTPGIFENKALNQDTRSLL